MKKKFNITMINTILSFVLQILTIINGFIIPKLILTYFGSDVNGLVASLTKFLSYISILEGGVTGVIMASLYKPLNRKDNEKVSSILVTTTSFYRKISFVFIIYSLLLAISYPLLFDTGFSYFYVFSLTLILSINSFVQYCFSLTYRTLLKADKKLYFEAIVQSILLIFNIVFSIIIINLFPSVHILKLLSALIFVIQPVAFNIYVRKNYDINKNAKKDNSLLKARWDGFSINIAAFIHTNTDILILNFFTTLANVSVYSVYAFVGSGLRTLLSSFSNGVAPTLGQLYAEGNIDNINNKLDIYENIIFLIVFWVFSVACLLIVPFVMIYTININDANYYQPIFGILLMISEGLYLIKMPHVDLAFAANKFKEMTVPVFIEAFINIIISLLLVRKLGLIGVAIGTLVAMTYRLIYHIAFTKKMINRPQHIFYKKFLVFMISTVVGLSICILFIPAVKYNFLNWIIKGLIYSIIMLIHYLLFSFIFLRKDFLKIINYIKK